MLGAHQKNRQLARQELVIGEAGAGQGSRLQVRFAVGLVGRDQGRVPGGPPAPGDQRRVGPFRHLRRRLRQRPLNRLRGHFQGQARRQAIDRLDRCQTVPVLDGADMIGVGHLLDPPIVLDRAADDSGFAGRERAQEIIRLGVEEDQNQGAGRVRAVDPIGLASGRAGLMGLNRDGQGSDAPRRRVRDRGRKAPVDDPARQMPQEIDHLVSRRLFEQGSQARADPGQGGHGREEGKKDLWAHRVAAGAKMAADLAPFGAYIVGR